MGAFKLYSEILEDFEKAETKEERVKILRTNGTPHFKTFLFLILDKEVEFDVEVPKYRPAIEPAGLNFTYLDQEMRKMYLYIKNHPVRPAGLSVKKQLDQLVVTLESLHKDEASLLANMLNKSIKIKNLTPRFVKEVFPDLNLG